MLASKNFYQIFKRFQSKSTNNSWMKSILTEKIISTKSVLAILDLHFKSCLQMTGLRMGFFRLRIQILESRDSWLDCVRIHIWASSTSKVSGQLNYWVTIELYTIFQVQITRLKFKSSPMRTKIAKNLQLEVYQQVKATTSLKSIHWTKIEYTQLITDPNSILIYKVDQWSQRARVLKTNLTFQVHSGK